MRLATWNCQTGLDSNWAFVEDLAADVLTIQECGPATREQAAERGWACSWRAGGWDKGLAVLARPPYRLEPEESPEPFLVSTVVEGPIRFRFVGFWAMTPRFAKLEYPAQATRLIEHLPDDGLPTVVAGDFNASKSRSHLLNVESLRGRGLVSAYHAYHGVAHDAAETHPTSFHLWDRSRPFHMDFIFVPSRWRIESVDVGTYDDYPGRRLSDHVPVVATAKNTKLRKTTASKATAKKSTAEKVTGKKTTNKVRTRAIAQSSTPSKRASSSALPAQPGDIIVIDSPQVGSPAREGEVLSVTEGAFSVSYQVRWTPS